MILFNNILQTCNSYVGNGDHTVPLAQYKHNNLILCKKFFLPHARRGGYYPSARQTDVLAFNL